MIFIHIFLNTNQAYQKDVLRPIHPIHPSLSVYRTQRIKHRTPSKRMDRASHATIDT